MILKSMAFSLLVILGIVISLAGCDLERGMGELVGQQEFEALDGYDHGWFAHLEPGKEYRITVKTAGATNKEILAILSINKAIACETCDLRVSGYLNQNELVVTFIAPSDGRVNIVLHITGADIPSIIKVSPIDPWRLIPSQSPFHFSSLSPSITPRSGKGRGACVRLIQCELHHPR